MHGDETETPRRPRRSRSVPFLGHQIVEYAVAVALVAVGFHLNGGAEFALAASGIALIVLNLATAGPLGAVSALSRQAHHAGDLVIAAVLIVAPFLVPSELHLSGIVLSEAIAALIVWIERSTRYAIAGRNLKAAPTGEALPPGEPGVIQSAGMAAAALAPDIGRATRVAARRAGFVAGVTRRVIRRRREDSGRESR